MVVVVAVFETVGVVMVVVVVMNIVIYTPTRRGAEKDGNFDVWEEFVAFAGAAVVWPRGRRQRAADSAVEGFASVAAAEEEGGNTEDEDKEKKAGDSPGVAVGEESILPVFGR